MRASVWRICVFGVGVLVSVAASAADGDLDRTFNQTGQVTLPLPSIPGGFLRAADLAIQKDGRILLLGTSQSFAPLQLGDAHLVRLDKNGAMDRTFDGDGVVTTDFDGRGQVLRALALQSDGKILVGGTDSDPGRFDNLFDFLLIRYTKSGTLDPTFGAGKGYVLLDRGLIDDLQAVAVQKDKKIVAAGWTIGFDGLTSLAVVRFLADGRPDPDFGPQHDGVVTARIDDKETLGFGIAIQSDGKIVVTGQAGLLVGATGAAEATDGAFFAARFLSDGRPDTSFDTDGAVRLSETGSLGWAGDVKLQKDGKILLGGNIFNATGSKASVGIYRLDASGKRDKTWGKNGLAKVDFTPGPDVGGGMALGANGKLIVIGTANRNPLGTNREADIPQLAIARLLTNGKPDQTFGVKGKKLFALDPTGCGAQAVALQKDGKIVVGSELAGAGTSRLAATRHLAAK
jgi:uncharacterized delta-60 repeat protein